MNKKIVSGIGAALVGFAAFADFAAAQQDSGLVGLHTLRREGGKICMIDHTHTGTSSGQPTRKAAEAAAARDFAGFTAWEYGGHWGNFALAGSKQMSCSQGGGGWSCSVEARPCKPAR